MASTGVNSTIRLTRRGRWLLVLTVMILLVIAGFTLGRGSSLAASGAHRGTHRSVVVQPGETMWSVAVRVAPQVDPRLVVADIQSLNHLSSAGVEPGEQLLVPTFG